MFIKQNKEEDKMTKNIYAFEPLPNGQSRIKITRPSGECLLMIFNSTFPLNVADYYIKLIETVFEKHPNVDSDDYFGLFIRYCANNMLETPLGYGTYRDMERIRLGQRIREIRERKGMSAIQLALKTNIDAGNLSRIEQGKLSVGLDILARIASALGYRLDLVEMFKTE